MQIRPSSETRFLKLCCRIPSSSLLSLTTEKERCPTSERARDPPRHDHGSYRDEEFSWRSWCAVRGSAADWCCDSRQRGRRQQQIRVCSTCQQFVMPAQRLTTAQLRCFTLRATSSRVRARVGYVPGRPSHQPLRLRLGYGAAGGVGRTVAAAVVPRLPMKRSRVKRRYRASFSHDMITVSVLYIS